MSAYDAYLTAQVLAEAVPDSDAVTHADMDAAAELAGVSRPAGSDDRAAVRLALDAIGGAR
jgi:hypothetical protein